MKPPAGNAYKAPFRLLRTTALLRVRMLQEGLQRISGHNTRQGPNGEVVATRTITERFSSADLVLLN